MTKPAVRVDECFASAIAVRIAATTGAAARPDTDA
jgi:hypothetical protein